MTGVLFKWELRVGVPRPAGPMTLVPLFGGLRAPDYALGAELMAAGTLTIREVGQGSVPDLLASNLLSLPALLIDGEALEGARQDRVLNSSALLPAGKEIVLPVSCVEAGRWEYRGAGDFAISPQTAHAGLRMRSRAEVGTSLRAGLSPKTQQARVWRDVALAQGMAGVTSSPTRAMRDSYASRKDWLDRTLHQAAEPEAEQTGVVVSYGGHAAVLDVFERPQTLRALWPRLLRGYAMDAVVSGLGPDVEDVPVDRIESFVRSVGRAKATAHPGIGLGENVVLTGRQIVGEALVWDEGVVHASAFTVPEGPDDGSSLRSSRAPIRRHRFGFRG